VLTHVPFVVKPPRGVPVRPRMSEALVELVDFPATVFDLAGIQPGYTHFGRSLLPVLAGSEEHRDAVFCEGGLLEGEDHCQEGGTKPAVENNYWPRVSLLWELHVAHSKAVMCRIRHYKYVRRLYEADEFYDLRNDPCETTNLREHPMMARHRERRSRFSWKTVTLSHSTKTAAGEYDRTTPATHRCRASHRKRAGHRLGKKVNCINTPLSSAMTGPFFDELS
jgi:arylsulfatase A-like enzyme